MCLGPGITVLLVFALACPLGLALACPLGLALSSSTRRARARTRGQARARPRGRARARTRRTVVLLQGSALHEERLPCSHCPWIVCPGCRIRLHAVATCHEPAVHARPPRERGSAKRARLGGRTMMLQRLLRGERVSSSAWKRRPWGLLCAASASFSVSFSMEVVRND